MLALAPAAASELTVIYSGETHAMLNPCDSPDDPGGGLAERAAFLSGAVAGRNELLLIDGGGFSGGGIYDSYSAGRAADSVRTAKTIAAMGLMGYDAAGVGDDDLQYGGQWLADRAKEANLPLVCANCFTADGKFLVKPYVIVKKGDNTFAITSVVTSDRLFPVDTSVVIKDPFTSLEQIRREMRRRSQYQVLISHLGEQETGALLKRAPGFFLAANAHKKVSVQALAHMSKTPVLNFGFQGKSLSYAIFDWKNRALRLSSSGWFHIDGRTGADENVRAIIGTPEAQAPNVLPIGEENMVYDLYIMSLCPYGITALGELTELIRAFPQREWNVWFIGTAEDDVLTSMRGDEEMADEMLWLGVKALYPFRYHEFLFLRAEAKAPTEALLEEMGLDVGKIRYWAEDMGPDELRQHYKRSMSLDVNASPTLYINNKLYDKPMGGGRLVRDKCRAVNPMPPFCNDYPECFEDGDCRMAGKLGRCADIREGDRVRAACEFRDDVAFALTVLVADSAASNPEKAVIEGVYDMLPGAQAGVVKLSSDEGKRIMAVHNPAALPFFHFGQSVDSTFHFASIRDVLEPANDGYRFKKGTIKENYYPQRREKPGLIELYADPLMPDIGRVINALLSNPDLAKRIVLRPIVHKAPTQEQVSAQDRLRAEEALRWILLADEFPKNYMQYLKAYSEQPASSYWFNWLKPIRINPKKFLKRIEANRYRIDEYLEDFSTISSGEPVMIMINNRAKITVSNERELERALKSIRY